MREVRCRPIADLFGLGERGWMLGAFIPPGTKVRYDGSDEGPEYGVVVHCWGNDEMGGYDCYVAFFGDSIPNGQPSQKPHVLRYAATSLNVICE